MWDVAVQQCRGGSEPTDAQELQLMNCLHHGNVFS